MLKIEITSQKLYEGCIQKGCRGVITFHSKYIVAAFRNESKLDLSKDALFYFDEAPAEIIDIANSETLAYLLDEVNGIAKPLVTAAMWGSWENLFSNQPINVLLENCDYIIKNQIMDLSEAMEQWDEYYEFHDEQDELVRSLFNRRKSMDFNFAITIDEHESKLLYGETHECVESLRELNIFL